MPAAAAGGGCDYTRLVQSLDWDQLYEEHDLGVRLEALRAEWVREFDLVLVDSRTGVTDFSGLVTAQLPDILAFMFTANEQSLAGCADIARRAMEARRRMSVDRHALIPLPIPARFDQRDEFDRAKTWRARFASELKPFLDKWAPLGTDGLSLIDRLTLPYMARWTFGEDLAAEEEPAGSSGTRTPNQVVSYALETLAATLVLRLTDVPLLVSSRDEYVLTARSTVQGWQAATRSALDVFVSYTAADRHAAQAIASALTAAGFKPQAYEDKLLSHVPWAEQRLDALERADGYVVVFGSTKSLYQQDGEIAQIQRQGLRSRSVRRPIIPVVLPDGKEAFANSSLADYQAYFVDPSNGPLESQLQTALERLRFARGAGSTFA
jgi:hypothetical protein